MSALFDCTFDCHKNVQCNNSLRVLVWPFFVPEELSAKAENRWAKSTPLSGQYGHIGCLFDVFLNTGTWLVVTMKNRQISQGQQSYRRNETNDSTYQSFMNNMSSLCPPQ